MVTEKLAAASESVLAGSKAAGKAALRRQTRNPIDAVGAMAEIATAAALPFQKRVNANAKRLSRKRT